MCPYGWTPERVAVKERQLDQISYWQNANESYHICVGKRCITLLLTKIYIVCRRTTESEQCSYGSIG